MLRIRRLGLVARRLIRVVLTLAHRQNHRPDLGSRGVPQGVPLTQQRLEIDPPNLAKLSPWPLYSCKAHALQPGGLGGVVPWVGHGFSVRPQKHTPAGMSDVKSKET